jgi:hypothetical protein
VLIRKEEGKNAGSANNIGMDKERMYCVLHHLMDAEPHNKLIVMCLLFR